MLVNNKKFSHLGQGCSKDCKDTCRVLLIDIYHCFGCLNVWKDVLERGKASEKGEQAREEMVKDVNGQILCEGVEVRRIWGEYFEQVLNVVDGREANLNVVGNWLANNWLVERVE